MELPRRRASPDAWLAGVEELRAVLGNGSNVSDNVDSCRHQLSPAGDR
jgi:hypothetical protein